MHMTKCDSMKLKEGQKHDEANAACKSDSLSDTIHKVTVVSPFVFKIGDTRKYEAYEKNSFGVAKQLRMKTDMKFESFEATMLKGPEKLPQDENLAFCDFEKLAHN